MRILQKGVLSVIGLEENIQSMRESMDRLIFIVLKVKEYGNLQWFTLSNAFEKSETESVRSVCVPEA